MHHIPLFQRQLLPKHKTTKLFPKADLRLMIRMLIVGYVFAIRSERALCSSNGKNGHCGLANGDLQ